MNKSKIIIAIAAILFAAFLTLGVTTLSLEAELDDSASTENPGKWASVCCGAVCPNGLDHCIGSGTFKCCK